METKSVVVSVARYAWLVECGKEKKLVNVDSFVVKMHGKYEEPMLTSSVKEMPRSFVEERPFLKDLLFSSIGTDPSKVRKYLLR